MAPGKSTLMFFSKKVEIFVKLGALGFEQISLEISNWSGEELS